MDKTIDNKIDEKINKAIEVVKGKFPALTVHVDMQKAAQGVLNLKMAKAQYATFSKPTTEFDEELTFLLGRVRPNLGATEMQQVTQAVLHLMQAKAQGEGGNPPAKAPKTKTN